MGRGSRCFVFLTTPHFLSHCHHLVVSNVGSGMVATLFMIAWLCARRRLRKMMRDSHKDARKWMTRCTSPWVPEWNRWKQKCSPQCCGQHLSSAAAQQCLRGRGTNFNQEHPTLWLVFLVILGFLCMLGNEGSGSEVGVWVRDTSVQQFLLGFGMSLSLYLFPFLFFFFLFFPLFIF